MRLKILLTPLKRNFELDINYHYSLASAVYKIFSNGSESIAEWLHNTGFLDEKGRKLKIFNFSNLLFDSYQVKDSIIEANGSAYFLFSSPIETNLIKTFVDGVFKDPRMEIFSLGKKHKFQIATIDILQDLETSDKMSYKAITPISVSKQVDEDGRLRIKYLSPESTEFTERIENNLRKKYELLNKSEYTGKLIMSTPNENYIKSKLITIKQGRADETKVKGFLTKLDIEANGEMQRLAYYCGLGERNSLGFGMIEKIGG